MSSDGPSAAWHPAFMPHTAADLVREPVPRDEEVAGDSTYPAEGDCIVEHVPDSKLEAVPVHDSAQARNAAGEDWFPEYESASPWLEEHPQEPAAASLEADVEDGTDAHALSEDAQDQEFASATAAKHASTVSFARTVSHDVNWDGEDDDPEWDLSKTEIDPFKFMPPSDRTNSFPPVPPPQATEPHAEDADQPLPSTQAEHIMHELGERSQLAHDHLVHTDVSARDVTSREEQDLGVGAESQHSMGGELLGSNGEDFEARYAEGLPLISQNAETETAVQSENELQQDPFAEPGGDDDDFFNNIGSQDEGAVAAAAPEGHTLERKSTQQVLGSMDFGLSGRQDTGLEDMAEEAEQPAIAAPEVSSAGQDSGDAQPAEGGDLAAKWAAAFATDDDDDEFLLEDTPVDSKAIDPAAFFVDDDEGFLEDTEDLTASAQPATSSVQTPATAATSAAPTSNQYIPTATSFAPSQTPNAYAPNNAAQLVQPPTPFGYNALTPVSPAFPGAAYQPSPAVHPEPSRAQSFVDKAKGGYHSPYDLPMEVVKPRKRQSLQHLTGALAAAVPPPLAAPPRSSSMHSPTTQTMSPPSSSHGGLPSPGTRPPADSKKHTPSFFEELPMSSKPRPASRHSHTSLPSPAQPSPYSQSQTMAQGPPQTAQLGPPHHIQPAVVSPPATQQAHAPAAVPGIVNLLPPERVSPYAPLQSNSAPQASIPPAASNMRYSPAPPPLQHANSTASAPPSNRYSPAPSSRAPSGGYAAIPQGVSNTILPHQPRTSSPLAHFEISNDRPSRALHTSHSDSHIPDQRRGSSSVYESRLNRVPSLPPTREVEEEDISPRHNLGEDAQNSHHPMHISQIPRQSPPQTPHTQSLLSPPKRLSSYTPQPQASPGSHHPEFAPPPRSHTQSPGALYGNRAGGRQAEPVPRPSSVHDPTSPRSSVPTMAPVMAPTSTRPSRPRGFSQNLNLVPPTDGREQDPLQRWKGCPIISWGVGGTFVTSFPKDIPRYGMSQALPMIIRSPGDVKVKNIKDIEPLEDRLTRFPGPLKGKSKKKETLAWLSSGIETLERSLPRPTFQSFISLEDKRAEERVLLWKVLRLLIEHDGALEGSPIVDKAVRDVLSPGGSGQTTTPYGMENGAGAAPSALAGMTPDAVDPSAIEQIRDSLLAGDREKAVWDAADKRLWGHALLIASSVSPDLYKKVTQEFVRKEVNYPGHQNESIGALYEILAGNHEESVDELVPVHARAGLQLMATTPASAISKDSLDGLDKWRETLGLVLSNRSTNDTQALCALGTLLSGYGRAEAAHICFLFARNVSVFGGLDDPQANFVLVGSDHRSQEDQFAKEIEPLLLSEVYEYGLSLAGGPTAATGSPHLAVYKLQHAIALAEYGYRDKALQYCEAISASITAQTRRSPYHHAVLEGAVEDLMKRLKQAPKGESNSWMSKPSMNKVSDSMWNRFNKFVAGDEGEAGPDGAAAGGTESGPFGRLAGGTPTISRPPSPAGATGMEMFGGQGQEQANPYAAASSAPTVAPPTLTRAGSRYAPAAGNAATPAATYEPGSAYTPAGRSSMERSSGEYNRSSYEQPRRSGEYSPGYAGSSGAPNGTVMSPGYSQPVAQTPQQSSYTPYAPVSQPQAPAAQQSQPEYHGYNPDPATNGSPYAPAPIVEVSPAKGEEDKPVDMGYQPPSYGYEPPAVINTSYEPPSLDTNAQESEAAPATTGGYEPPSYQPYGYEPPSYNPEPEAGSEGEVKPRKSFMDDDEDDIPALKPKEKSKEEKDRENAEMFRKIAEEEAKRAEAEKAAKGKKGWGLTSWFGGAGGASKKDLGSAGGGGGAGGADPNKPIRANLGEKSSFYFDPELKRWVNKNAPADDNAAKKAAPAPPPRSAPRSAASTPPPPSSAPPMRSGLGGGLPPSSSVPNLAAAAAMARSGSSAGAPPPPPSAPPSRPATSMSNASSIDDLLSAAGPRKPGAKKGRKGGRYIDVMAK